MQDKRSPTCSALHFFSLALSTQAPVRQRIPSFLREDDDVISPDFGTLKKKTTHKKK
jgi:hypothetical protein